MTNGRNIYIQKPTAWNWGMKNSRDLQYVDWTYFVQEKFRECGFDSLEEMIKAYGPSTGNESTIDNINHVYCQNGEEIEDE